MSTERVPHFQNENGDLRDVNERRCMLGWCPSRNRIAETYGHQAWRSQSFEGIAGAARLFVATTGQYSHDTQAGQQERDAARFRHRVRRPRRACQRQVVDGWPQETI